MPTFPIFWKLGLEATCQCHALGIGTLPISFDLATIRRLQSNCEALRAVCMNPAPLALLPSMFS